MKRCVIVGGAPNTDTDFLKRAILPDDFILAADKGYYYLKLVDIIPDVFVGDCDSYHDNDITANEIIKLNVIKDDTDTEHAFSIAYEKGYRNFVFLGVTGGRNDHFMANLNLLFRANELNAKAIILSPFEKIIPLNIGDYTIENKGKTFSLLPYGCKDITVSYVGVQYILNSHKITYDSSLGVSNVFTDDVSTISIESGNALLFINN